MSAIAVRQWLKEIAEDLICNMVSQHETLDERMVVVEAGINPRHLHLWSANT